MRRDLIVVPLGFDFPGRTQPIFTDELVCVVARDNPRLDGRRADPGGPAGDAARGGRVPVAAGDRKRPLEVEVEQNGLADRAVLVQVTSLLTLPFAVAGTDMCAFVPARLARRCLDMLDLVDRRDPAGPGADHRGGALASAAGGRPGRGLAAPAAATTWPCRSRTRRRRRQVGDATGSRLAVNPSSGRARHHQRRDDRRVLAAEPDQRRDHRAEGELGEAEHGAAGAGHLADLGHRQRGGVAHDPAVAGDREEDRHGVGPRRRPASASTRKTSVAVDLDGDRRPARSAAARPGRRAG